MGNALEKRVERAQKTGVFALSNEGLAKVPADLEKLKAVLRTLDLSGNNITDLPPAFATFTNLKHLTLASNRIEVFPAQISSLVKLETLSLAKNRLSTLPGSAFVKLTDLKKLVASDNRISAFPSELCSLAKLEVINLSGNVIETLPDQVGHLSCHEINLDRNRLVGVPSTIGDNTQLRVLRLSENCIVDGGIPARLLEDSAVSLIIIDANPLDMHALQDTPAYEKYLARNTAARVKAH
eukprot:Opistho-2@94338